MRRPHGYATIVDPDGPLVERDTATCCHCSAVIITKPHTGSTTYLIQVPGVVPGTFVWQEVPGASCYHCFKPVCLACDAKGTCTPLERWLEQHEAKGNFLRSAGLM